MIYIKLDTGEFPVFEGDVLLQTPGTDTSFILPPGYASVTVLDAPEYNSMTHFLDYGVPVFNNNTNRWEVELVTKEFSTEFALEKTKKMSDHERNPALKLIMQRFEKEHGL